ncbi:MAG: PDR/VanB family oxidoreductase [Burkholderiaceae bacterium]
MIASDKLPTTPPHTQVWHLQVRGIRLQAHGIVSYELADPDGHDLPVFEPGAHVDVLAPGGLVRAYSLASDPRDRSHWLLGVLKEPKAKSTGGSIAMHEHVRVGQLLTVGPLRHVFAMATQAKHTVLLAGGIGITPLKSMAHELVHQGASFELHYCARSAQHAAFSAELLALVPPDRLHFHYDNGDTSQGLDIAKLLHSHAVGTHVYFCGPAGFMKACAASSAHWPTGHVHTEYFKAPDSASVATLAGSFDVILMKSGERVTVGPDQTIVRALELAGRRVPTSCLSGLCGTCKVDYLDGEVDHHDYILSDDDKKTCLTLCVSRALSPTLTLDL